MEKQMLIISFALSFLICTTFNANCVPTIYSNGFIDLTRGSALRSEEQPPQHVTDDFILNMSPYKVSEVAWWGGYDPRIDIPPDDFYIRIYLDVDGHPSDIGTEIHSVHLGPSVTSSDTGYSLTWGVENWKVSRYQAAIPGFIASAGEPYWISITNNTPESSWWWSEDSGGNAMVASQNSNLEWHSYSPQLGGSRAAFELSGQWVTDCYSVFEISVAECFALINLYDSTNGPEWVNNEGWGIDNTPCSWYGITCVNGGVEKINLEDNNLAGPLPTSLGNLSQLKQLELQFNQLSGIIPMEISSIPLATLNFFHNELTGPIPPDIGGISTLSTLDLCSNNLSGPIPPELGMLTALSDLKLCGNQLNGSIPPEIGNLSNLSVLFLEHNQLTGTIPPELGNLENLFLLNLENNGLSGNIPEELGYFENIALFALAENQLSGSVPLSVATLGANISFCTLRFNDSSLCMPATPAYAVLGEDPLCELPLDTECKIENVDLEDVILTIQVVGGMTPEPLTLQADVDGDGKLGISDAISILDFMAGF